MNWPRMKHSACVVSFCNQASTKAWVSWRRWSHSPLEPLIKTRNRFPNPLRAEGIPGKPQSLSYKRPPAWNVVEGNQGRLLNGDSSLGRERSSCQPALCTNQLHEAILTYRTQTIWRMPQIRNWSKNQRAKSDGENGKQWGSGCFNPLSFGVACSATIDAL